MSDQAPADQLIAYAVHALERGERDAALMRASEACHGAPGDPRAHYVYGQAWTACGEHTRAERAFAEAIRLAPASPDAWVNYGIARYRQGFIADAKVAMRQALRHAPGHPVALANLGAFMRISGESEAAEALLRQAAAAPGGAGAKLNLAADLIQEGQCAEALATLDGPPPADLAMARHWHLQRSLALIELGRLPEARDSLAEVESIGPMPPEAAPLWHWRRALLARAEGDGVRARGEAAQMAASLGAMGPHAIPEHRIMGHYDLAKLYSGWGEDGAAIAQWSAGHALLRQTQPFSRAAHRAMVDATIATFSAERLRDGPCATNRDPAPVFIVGMPRSGTTLCEQIIAAHPQAFGAGERTALSETAAMLSHPRDLDAATLDAAAERYLADLHALAPGQARIVDKMPGNYLHVGLAALMLPSARFIHTIRDPRDIGFSIFTFRFYGVHGYAHDLSDLGWTIAQQIRLMDHFKRAMPDRVITVRLDEWVYDFDGTLARVLAHLGLTSDPACARFYEQDSRVRTVSREQVRKPVNASGLGRWRRYAAHLQPLIAELHAECLAEWDARLG